MNKKHTKSENKSLDALEAREEFYKLSEEMSALDLSTEEGRKEFERLDRKQDKALRDEFRADGYFD